MSGTKPTLDDYFARARKAGVPATDSTLDLLAEYGAKAARRRKRRFIAVTAISCAILGTVAFEFAAHSPVPHGAVADAAHTTQPAAKQLPHHTDATTGALASASAPAPHSEAPHASSGVRATRHNNPTPGIPQRAQKQTFASAISTRAFGEQQTQPTENIPAPDAIAVSDADLLAIPVSVQSQPARYIAPDDAPAMAVFSAPPQEDSHTVGLTVGAKYGTAAADISPINQQLAGMGFPTLRSQFEQATIQAGIAVGNATFGVAYTAPYAESVMGTHPPSPLSSAAGKQASVVTTFDHKRWSAFGEYSFAIADNVKLDAGAQVSLTAYELGFESNYTPVASIDSDPSAGMAPPESWGDLWGQLRTPSDFTNSANEKATMPFSFEGIATRSVGISPTLGISWRAIPSINLQCKVGYLFNLNHEWRTTSTDTPVEGVSKLLRMNEYSISIGASFYQWLF